MKKEYLKDLQKLEKLLNEIYDEMETHQGEAIVMDLQEKIDYLKEKTERQIYIEETGDEFGRKGIEY